MKGKIIALLMGLLLATSAHADYLIGAYVDSDLEVDAPFNELFDDGASGFMVGYGWDTPHSWLSMEVTYTDFGDSNRGESYVDDGYSESINFGYEGRALDLWLVGRFSPFNITEKRPLNIVPRLGLSVADSVGTVSYAYTTPYGSGGQSQSASDSGVGYAYGLGIEIANVISDVDIFVDWRKHEVEMVYLGQQVDFNPSTVQLGINYHF